MTMFRFPEKVETAGDALARLQYSLEASNVLSDDYRRSVLGWAYKAVELADHARRPKPRNDWNEGDLVEDNEGDKGVITAVCPDIIVVRWDCTGREGTTHPHHLTNLTTRVLEG